MRIRNVNRGRVLMLLIVCAPLILSACGTGAHDALIQSSTPVPPSPAIPIDTPGRTPVNDAGVTPLVPSAGCARRVLIISIDGLRPDVLSPLRTPNMMRLAQRGAFTSQAQTTTASTLPAHASMLSGYTTFGHGVFWNDYIPLFGFIRTSTVFSIAQEHGLRTIMLVAKEKLIHIAAPGTVDDYVYVPEGDAVIVEAGIERMSQEFGIMFIHLRALDSTGHRFGWMSSEYLAVTNRSDQRIGDLLEALEEQGLGSTTLVIITSDHGGSGTNHGSRSAQDMTIPWIVAGPAVMAGVELVEGVSVMDTAITALWAMALPLPDEPDGRPIIEAFAPDVVEACGLEPIMLNASVGSE